MKTTDLATAVIGAGRLARSLLPLLGPAGYPVVAVAARRLASARSACRTLSSARATTSLRSAVEHAQLVLLAVPDREIEPVAERLSAASAVDWHGRVVLHHAGALGTEPLAALAGAGAAVGVLHPLQCLGSPELAPRVLPGSRARIEGDPRARSTALRLARKLGLEPLSFRGELAPADRIAYHTAASLLSNDLLGLLAIGIELLESVGLSRRAAVQALVALARGTLAQVEAGGLGAALTGPAARGDVETLEAQLGRLSRGSEEHADIHRLLSLRLARLADEHGESRAAESIELLLAGRDRKAEV